MFRLSSYLIGTALLIVQKELNPTNGTTLLCESVTTTTKTIIDDDTIKMNSQNNNNEAAMLLLLSSLIITRGGGGGGKTDQRGSYNNKNSMIHIGDNNVYSLGVSVFFSVLPFITIATGIISLILIIGTPMLVMLFDDPRNATSYEPYFFGIMFLEVTYTLSKITLAFIQMIETRTKNTFLQFMGYKKGTSITLFVLKHLTYGFVIPIALLCTFFTINYYIIERLQKKEQ